MKNNLILLFSFLLIANILSAQENNDFTSFLKPTQFIDSDNPEIISKANELTQNCKSDTEKVKALFEFVRDTYSDNVNTSTIASDILKEGGTSCYCRSILLAALCRAVNIPSRLQYQYMLLKDYYYNEEKKDHLFNHAIVGIYLNGEWFLYESVGNNEKWKVWVEKKNLDKDVTIQFKPNQDCLFTSTEKVILKTLPIYFSDHSEDRYDFIMKIVTKEIGFDCDNI